MLKFGVRLEASSSIGVDRLQDKRNERTTTDLHKDNRSEKSDLKKSTLLDILKQAIGYAKVYADICFYVDNASDRPQ